MPEFLRRMENIAAGVDPTRIEGELGAMCQRSLFFALRSGSPVSQADIDAATRAFLTTTERFMPAQVVHGFVEHACQSRILPSIDHAALVPGFTHDESFAGLDGAARSDNPVKKFTRSEALGCLRWNQREPVVAVAMAHLIDLVHTYVAALGELVAQRSPAAGEALQPFIAQWRPKNALTFVNVALHVAATRRSKDGPVIVDHATIVDAVTLLDRSGAFVWSSKDDRATLLDVQLKIRCPAQAFLHKLLANQGTLALVLRFVRKEATRIPMDSEVEASLEFIRQTAAREEAAIMAASSSDEPGTLDGAHGASVLT